MVNFDDFRKVRENKTVIIPRDIFLRLPKPPGVDDLWQSQAEALDEWFTRREEQDLVLKLNTGGGKTLVGLLIAQSTLAEKDGPVLFLCATNQLAQQTISHAQQFGIRAVPYVPGQDLHSDFLNGRAIMIASYQALFNGLSKFGTAGRGREIVRPAAIVLDDAHTAFSVVREQFSISIGRNQQTDLYQQFTQDFRYAFEEIGSKARSTTSLKLGTKEFWRYLTGAGLLDAKRLGNSSLMFKMTTSPGSGLCYVIILINVTPSLAEMIFSLVFFIRMLRCFLPSPNARAGSICRLPLLTTAQ